MNKDKGFNLKQIILIAIITSLITSITTGVIVYNQNKLTKNITYKDLSEDEALTEFLEVYASLTDEYYEDVDKSALLESGIEAMFDYLGEDYSTYLSKEETDSLAEKLSGETNGIGISINTNFEVVSLTENGPAINSGIQVGDIITKINNQDTSTLSLSDVSDMISNLNVGNHVTINVKRGEEELEYNVEVSKIAIPNVSSKMLNNNIGYLKITAFSSNLSELTSSALSSLEENNMKSLIIDLRDNTGGYIAAAREVASMFLKKDTLIFSLEEKDETTEYKDTTEESKNYKVIILQNEETASASEILIAALKENYGAITVGKTTYGKGKVQQTYTLENGSMVKYTSARWLTPSGNCIDEIGISPDYEVENTSIEDNQLLTAITLAS